MGFRVDVAPRAQRDLDRIYDWIISSEPFAGLRWLVRFENSILSLANFPQRCRILFPSQDCTQTDIRNHSL
jgi:plasmid stabilization system protein ParE